MRIKTSLNYSPNFSTSARNKKNIKYIVYHYTGMRSENKAIKRLTDLNSNVSCHYFIKRNGQIINIIDIHVFYSVVRLYIVETYQQSQLSQDSLTTIY